MKQFGLILCTVLLASACSNTGQEAANTPITYSETVIETVGENKGLAESTLEIKGMSCAIMCGTTIKNNVSELAGVQEVEIDFDMERETNFCTVKFDSSVLTPIEIAAKIQSLNKGAYHVLAVETSKWIEKQLNESSTKEMDDKKSASIRIGDIIPSVFNVLTRVLKQ